MDAVKLAPYGFNLLLLRHEPRKLLNENRPQPAQRARVIPDMLRPVQAAFKKRRIERLLQETFFQAELLERAVIPHELPYLRRQEPGKEEHRNGRDPRSRRPNHHDAGGGPTSGYQIENSQPAELMADMLCERKETGIHGHGLVVCPGVVRESYQHTRC